MYTISEVAKMLKMSDRGVRVRCKRLGIKSAFIPMIVNERNFQRIRDYKHIQVFRTSFYFSEDGRFIIINSRMNKIS